MLYCLSAARRPVAALVVLLSLAAPAAAQDLLCDPARRYGGRDCRDILIQHIRQENVGLDVAFWFMEDPWMASEVIARWNAGVPVRILVDTEANTPNPKNALRLAEFQAAGIPMRERIASGILHWKMMLFAGQGIVEFSGANYSPDAWTVSGPDYTNYVDEAIYFTSKPSIVDSFRTRYDDLWTNTVQYRDYANITGPLTRVYDTYPIDPELNFVPGESHAVRAIGEYAKESSKIDVIMYRITDSRYADAMIAAKGRGVDVRLITEPQQYRDPIRQYHSWNIDRLHMAGIDIRNRAHAGLNHQKSVILYEQATTIFGSSNWSSASSESQEEHNLFTKDSWIFGWFVDQFERKWNNSTGVTETAPFAPLPPDAPTGPSPSMGVSGVKTTDVTLQWNGGYWAHQYDVYLGISPNSLSLIRANVARATSGIDYNNITLTEDLAPGTLYYWRVVGKTMADMAAESPIWSFTTAGVAPPKPTIDIVREPYLQQVSSNSAVLVWTTKQSGTAQVRLAPQGGATVTVAATSTLYPAGATGLASDYYQHVARLTGLTPATTYTYDVLVSGVDLNATIDTFRTAPFRGTGTVSFVAFGDSGTGSVEQQQIASLLDSEAFDLALHSGDLAYGNGSGTGGATHQTMQDWFFAMYRNWLRRQPVFPSIGNHDSRAENDNGRPYLDVFDLPTHGGNGTYADHAERYYSFDYGPMHVIVLDTELAFQDPARRAAQRAWAEADLAATNQPWKVALYHRSPYSAGGEHGSDLTVRETFGPLFDEYGVQLSLSAHEHTYERTVPLRATVPHPNGTTYVVTGGGGAPLYPSASETWTAHSASAYHYVRGTITECTLRLDAVGSNGTVFDGVTLQRCDLSGDTQAPQVSITAPSSGSTVKGMVSVTTTATDNIGVAAVELLVDGSMVARSTQPPFSFSWNSTAASPGSHTLTARASDLADNATTSVPVNVTVENPTLGQGDILLYAADATVVRGRWQKESDPTAAGGMRMRNPDAGAPKLTTALANPADYFELTFTAVPNVPYRFWMRGKGDADYYPNDSVFVQFTGTSDFRIGTTSAAEYNLEDCSGCRISGWGWQDNAWGAGVPSTPITFTTAGPHTIRIQAREDGLSIDQIMFSPVKFFSTSPGALKNDATIYPRSAGGDPTLPAPWSAQDIGAVGLAGSATVTNGTFTVKGEGVDIWNTADAFHFVWQPMTGDVDVIARVATVENVHAWVKAGVMIRERLTADSPHALMLVSPGKGLAFQRRVAAAGISTSTSGGAGTAPNWVKLERRGNTITAYRSADGMSWTLVGSDTFTMAATVHVGLAVSSHVSGRLATATFDNVVVRASGTTEPPPGNTAPAPTLPAPWTSQDIGAVGLAGRASESNGTFTVTGEGIDIWNTADAFQYVWQPLSGDADIMARVATVENVHAWVKAGVMIREGLNAGSAHALMLVSPGKGLAFQRRVATGGISTNTSGGTGAAPNWVKLERRGNTITAYRSADGLTWTLAGSDTFTMGSDVYVGLAISSHVSGRLATATFTNVSVVPR